MSVIRKTSIILQAICVVTAICAVILYNQANPAGLALVRMTSGSMCVTYDGACTGRTYASEPTIHVNDLMLYQQINPADLKTDYPDSDIIVFHQPGNPNELIVHRIVSAEEVNGVLYFRTKGDGNGFNKWPNTPQATDQDPWSIPPAPGVSEDQVVGKVVNTNFPLATLWIGLWLTATVSVAAGLAGLILFVVSRKNALDAVAKRGIITTTLLASSGKIHCVYCGT